MPKEKLSTQMRRRKAPEKEPTDLRGNDGPAISTGSTLLDLAISGGRFKNGGLPGGVLVEIFGPSATGKTVLLSEIAGNVQRKGSEVEFYDPEGRLNKAFALINGLDVDSVLYSAPNTIADVFRPIQKWSPETKEYPHGIFADSLAALTTEWDEDDKDAYGMRRAKEFSEHLRRVCRVLPDRNILLVCSNQVRVNVNAGPYSPKYKSPGGEAIGFYSSVRLRTVLKKKLKRKKRVRGKEHEHVIGVEIEVEVFKNSVWKPFHKAPVYIDFEYGVDDVKANLQFLKSNTKAGKYSVGEVDLGTSLERACELAEEQKLERKLKREVIKLWNEIEAAFSTTRTKRRV